jgi:hypothetical protein
MRHFLGAGNCALWPSTHVSSRFYCTITVCGVLLVYVFCVAMVRAQTYAGHDLFILTPPFPNQPLPQFSINDGSPSVAAGGMVVGESEGGPNVFPIQNALIWASPNGEITDLSPTSLPGFGTSVAIATDGVRQVGAAGQPPIISQGGFFHAVLWSGTADSAVDLNPNGYQFSEALGIGGNQQVGFAGGHAQLWTGTADSAVDLHPNFSGFPVSRAYGTDGTRQVGEMIDSLATTPHAILWKGNAASAVDLNPTNLPGFNFSIAYGVNGKSIVGDGGGSSISDFSHALLWTAGADSAIDLQPTKLSGVFGSVAYNTDGIHQVGYGLVDLNVGSRHALLWSGTADSAIDLNLLLPFDSVDSVANTIDPQGNIWGTATDSDGNIHAVEWSPVPEPASIVIALMGSILTFPMRHRRKAHSENSSFPAILPYSLHSP